MRVLLLNQFFWPDSSATSQLLTDLARGLVSEGHQVTVISSEKGGYGVSAASIDAPPVRSIRVRALPFVRGTAGRVLSYLTFYLAAAARGLFLPRQDLVVTLTTPPLLSLLGTLIKGVRGSRHFIWEMDMYPDVAVDLEYFKAGGVADHVVGTLADASRKYADGIIALGTCMKDRLIARGIAPQRISVADNWADGAAIQPLPRVPLPDTADGADHLVLLYSGNLGLAHDLHTLMHSIAALRGDDRFRFLFVGSGGRRDELAAFVAREGINSVELRPYVQRNSLSESLAAGDIGLVTQNDRCCGSVVPSKVYGLLAAGRPILFIGPAAATPAQILARFHCGWHVDVGDSAGLTALLQHLVASPAEIKRAGENARAALLQHFDLHHGVARVLSILGAGGSNRSAVLSTSLVPSSVQPASQI